VRFDRGADTPASRTRLRLSIRCPLLWRKGEETAETRPNRAARIRAGSPLQITERKRTVCPFLSSSRKDDTPEDPENQPGYQSIGPGTGLHGSVPTVAHRRSRSGGRPSGGSIPRRSGVQDIPDGAAGRRFAPMARSLRANPAKHETKFRCLVKKSLYGIENRWDPSPPRRRKRSFLPRLRQLLQKSANIRAGRKTRSSWGAENSKRRRPEAGLSVKGRFPPFAAPRKGYGQKTPQLLPQPIPMTMEKTHTKLPSWPENNIYLSISGG
jgi:hypothetical protein